MRAVGKVPIAWQGLLDQGVMPNSPPLSPTPPPSQETSKTTINNQKAGEEEAVLSKGSTQGGYENEFRPVVETWKCWGGLAGRAAMAAGEDGFAVVTAACWYLDFDSDFDDFFNANPLAVAKASIAEADVKAAKITTGTAAAGPDMLVNEKTSRFNQDALTHGGGALAREEDIIHQLQLRRRLRNHPSTTPPSAPTTTTTSTTAAAAAVGTRQSVYRRLSSEEYRKILLGGEAAMWTEHVDYTNLECRLWPRATAMAMHMWGYRHLADSNYDYATYNKYSTGRALVLSYILFREYLWNVMGVRAADITVHIISEEKMERVEYIPQRTIKYQVMDVESKAELLYYADSTNVTLTPSGTLTMPFKISSQCKGFPGGIQRPIGNELRLAQLNTAEGASAVNRRQLLVQWLTEQANHGVSIIGFCEANGWHNIDSLTSVKDNFPMVRGLAAEVGFTYSHVLHTDQHPFNIAFMSAHPFTIMGEYLPPLYERGVLHVYVEFFRLHVFVAHLNAHSSQDRDIETQHLSSLIKPLLARSERVIVMGDLNSLYRGDKALHDADKLLQLFQRTDNPVFPRLLKKMATADGTSINYKPLDNLVEAGLVELCEKYCSDHVMDYENDDCMPSRCAATEPTLYNPEVRDRWYLL